MLPKVSILIPMYNAQRYLSKTLESIFNQTYKNIEVIIVDDGSSDQSLKIAKRYEQTNLKVLFQRNAGACIARNRAFEESTGEYIQYLDADDLLSHNKIEDQIQLLNNSDAGAMASCSWFRFTHEDHLKTHFKKRLIDKDYFSPIEWLIDSWEGKGMSQTSCWLTPRYLIEKAGNWDARLLMNQDGEFFSRVLLNAKQIRYSSIAKVFYRVGNLASITGKITNEKCHSQLLSYRLYEEHILQNEDSARVRHALMRNYLAFMYYNYNACPGLMAEAKSAIKRLGFNSLETYGGGKFRTLARLIGFEAALMVRSKFDRFRSS